MTRTCVIARLVAALVLVLVGCLRIVHERTPDLTSLTAVRAEMVHPATKGADYQANLRLIAIDLLANEVRDRLRFDEPDREAQRYYDEATALMRGDKKFLARIAHVYAVYFSKTRRNGRAVPYVHREIELWEPLQEDYQKIAARDAAVSTLRDAGDAAGARKILRDVLARQEKYFVIGRWPLDLNEWAQYVSMLGKYASDARSLDELRRIIARLDAVISHYFPSAAPAIAMQLASELAARGDLEAAASHLAIAERGIDRRNPQQLAALECTRGNLAFARGDYARAATLYAACADHGRAAGSNPDTDLGLRHQQARVAEELGDDDAAAALYRKAIRLYETTRESYAVPERIQFFNSSSRESYWGLIRAAARRAARTGTPADASAALRASDLLRARQLGDLLDLETGAREVSLASVRAAIGSSTVIVSYSWTDAGLVIQVVDAGSYHAQVIPADPQLEPTIRRAAAALANPASDPSALTRDLRAVAHAVLDPVAPRLATGHRLIVLTDGPLALLPFEVLPLDDGGQTLVLDRVEVERAPSLRLMLAKRAPAAATGVFALGDPAYPARFGDLRAPFIALPETRREVETIARTVGGPATMLFGREATESKLRSPVLAKAGYVHFATHGVLGGDLPGLTEPALVLAGAPGSDGLLTASEASKLRLNARLTVLSACNTGSGELVTGEGVIGMSRAFLVAGSHAVVVSLWSVDSDATERLMELLYARMRAGDDAATALRAAKRALRGAGFEASSQRGLHRTASPTSPSVHVDAGHPYFWSAFVLVGTGAP